MCESSGLRVPTTRVPLEGGWCRGGSRNSWIRPNTHDDSFNSMQHLRKSTFKCFRIQKPQTSKHVGNKFHRSPEMDDEKDLGCPIPCWYLIGTPSYQSSGPSNTLLYMATLFHSFDVSVPQNLVVSNNTSQPSWLPSSLDCLGAAFNPLWPWPSPYLWVKGACSCAACIKARSRCE